jgi:putative transposase
LGDRCRGRRECGNLSAIMSQLSLKLPQRGGRRRGAGRKPKGPRPLVSHRARPRFAKPMPVHVTVRVARHVWNLRSRRCFSAVSACFAASCGRFGLRLIEFSVLGNHLHLVVEADSSEALSRGMQGLNVRVAKAVNRVMQRHGRVLADHYHARLLRTPTELVNAIAYVLGNSAHHYGIDAASDPFSSVKCDRDRLLARPRGWLLRVGWRRARPKLLSWIPRFVAVDVAEAA